MTARLALGLLVLLAGIDFHHDVQGRDVLSWMDPDQHYLFAEDVVEGRAPVTGFDVPTLYPLLLVPALWVETSIPAALWTQFAVSLALLAALHALARALALRTPSALVALLVLSSPLLVGLSRTLYTEYALSAAVAGGFLLWLHFLKSGREELLLPFGAALGVGFMLKMTYAGFFLLPVGAVVLERLATRRRGEALRIASFAALPVLLALAIEASVFPRAFPYYLALANTAIPITQLIGPPAGRFWEAAAYYPLEVGRSLLWLLTPGLLLAALTSVRRPTAKGWRGLAGPDAALWFWLLGPLLLFALQPVKEPRHVAPCVVPAVLLIVLGIERLPDRRLRVGLLALAGLAALTQLALVTTHRVEAPYFLDRPLHWQEIHDAMTRADDSGAPPLPLRGPGVDLWRYDHNFLIDGFPPNEALALTWQLFPGVVFDLPILEDETRLSDAIPSARFEDLYILTAFNAYNRRCGWHAYYDTLSRESALAHAEIVIWNDVAGGDPAARFPDHVPVASIPREPGTIRVLRARDGATPYRTLYARAFLARHPALPPGEREVVAREMLMTACLAGDREQALALLREHPGLRKPDPALRNLYWIGGYGALFEEARRRLARWAP